MSVGTNRSVNNSDLTDKNPNSAWPVTSCHNTYACIGLNMPSFCPLSNTVVSSV